MAASSSPEEVGIPPGAASSTRTVSRRLLWQAQGAVNLVRLRERLLVHEGHCGGQNGGEGGDAHAVIVQALLEETLDKAGARSL